MYDGEVYGDGPKGVYFLQEDGSIKEAPPMSGEDFLSIIRQKLTIKVAELLIEGMKEEEVIKEVDAAFWLKTEQEKLLKEARQLIEELSCRILAEEENGQKGH